MEKYKLPKEFAEKMIAALRETSEEKHITGSYYNPTTDCYCAMGLGLHANGVSFTRYGDPVMPEDKIVFHGAFKNSNPHVSLWDVICLWNDTEKLSFDQIANKIEQNVEFIETI